MCASMHTKKKAGVLALPSYQAFVIWKQDLPWERAGLKYLKCLTRVLSDKLNALHKEVLDILAKTGSVP